MSVSRSMLCGTGVLGTRECLSVGAGLLLTMMEMIMIMMTFAESSYN